ncbi:hypothetical protein NPIL_276241 [Nephila pilipes]|uniref:Uncharacterized protein n=1 Tax=Nephila pilipes TaxID=299642 RepID=A0A8X6PY83_NEPPI|nr:hypothetical protein NPIL_276241 [Nephila pilipes]
MEPINPATYNNGFLWFEECLKFLIWCPLQATRNETILPIGAERARTMKRRGQMNFSLDSGAMAGSTNTSNESNSRGRGRGKRRIIPEINDSSRYALPKVSNTRSRSYTPHTKAGNGKYL